MAGFARLLRTIWTDPDFLTLERADQGAYFMLLTQPGLSVAGHIPLQVRKLARLASDTTPEAIEKAIDRLIHDRFILVDDFTEELLIRTYIRHDGGWRTPNIHKAIVTAISRIESNELRAVATLELANTTRSQGMTDAVPDAMTEPMEERVGDLPAACSVQRTSLHPAASSAEPFDETSTTSALNTAAAAALEIFVQHRTNEKTPTNPTGFAMKIRREEPIRYAHEFAQLAPDADPIRAASAIFGIPANLANDAARQIGIAIAERPTQPPCDRCGNTGTITITEDANGHRTAGPCPDCEDT